MDPKVVLNTLEEIMYHYNFKKFVLEKLSSFYGNIGEHYLAETGSPDSLFYFYNHFPRFMSIINMCLKNGINSNKLSNICELGSFYPYSTYYFKLTNNDIKIDLYDMILNFLSNKESYNINGVKLINFNLCSDDFPENKYDLIILSEVLEHLPINLFDFEKKVINLMNEGSYLVVTYPLGGNNAKDYEKQISSDFDILYEHLREFTDETTNYFFNSLTKIDDLTISYPAYGLIKLVLYKK